MVRSKLPNIVEEEEYTFYRIVHGMPKDIVDLLLMQAITMNLNLDMMGGSELHICTTK